MFSCFRGSGIRAIGLKRILFTNMFRGLKRPRVVQPQLQGGLWLPNIARVHGASESFDTRKPNFEGSFKGSFKERKAASGTAESLV